MSDYEDDFELENLRQAALKSMQSKTSTSSVIGNSVSGSHMNRSSAGKSNQNYTKKNFHSQQPQQLPQQQPGPPFHAPFDQPPQFSRNQHFNSQYNSHPQPQYDQFGGGPPPFAASNPPFGNNVPLQHFNHQFSNQPPQFRNHSNHSNHQQFNGPPYPSGPQFNQPPPFTQPQKSNLIVISAGKSSNNHDMMAMNEHPMMPNSCYPASQMNPAMMPHPGHQPGHQGKHSRNGFGRQVNKKFGNNNRREMCKGRGPPNPSNQSDGRPKDVPTDFSKSADNLPSRFRRIDRDSSSEEDDEESDNDDNIERYRQTYDDTNEANLQDKEDSRPNSTSKTS